jgi:LacI family transcriptional regulator, gluconate utilization system Gnt-I transcriptional repressor
VAAHAGVTTMTVSRYLRAPAQVAPATAEKIIKALQTTAYTPNLQAGSLASGRSQAVAVIVPNMAHSIFADTLHGLGQGLQAAGLQMLVTSSGYSLAQEEAQLRAVLGWAPAAVVVTGRQHTPSACALLRAALSRGTPVLEMWDRSPAGEATEFTQIGFNHSAAGTLMAQALMSPAHGQRSLVYIDSGVAQDFRAHERAQGFAQEAKRQRRGLLRITAPQLEPVQAGHEAFITWHAKNQMRRPVAMAFANDLLACGALLAAQSLGYQLPQDISLLGFGDFPLGRHLGQGLSTLRIDGEQIGAACAAHIASQLRLPLSTQAYADLPPSTLPQPSDLSPQLCRRATSC